MPTNSTVTSPHTNLKTFKDVIRNFTPAWFAVNMGTGVVSSLFHSYPYGGRTKAMNSLALTFFFFNLILFTLFLVLTMSRYIMFPRVWRIMLLHPVQSLYLGCLPMAAATLINVALSVVHQYWGFGGVSFLYVLWALWWIDTILSIICCFGLVYVMTAHQQHSMSTLTPLWLLPIVTLIVASSTGQLLAAEIMVHSMPNALLTMGLSVIMVVIGLSLSLMILTLYVRRLLIEGLPDVGAIISSFIPLGPCGQAGYSLLLAGQNFKAAFPQGRGSVLGDELVGGMLNVICFFLAFVLWCMAVWWLLYAIIAIIDTIARRKKIPFKLAFWGLVFPNGVYAQLTIQLSLAMGSEVFRVLGAVYAPAVLLIWILLALPTLVQVFDKRIFHAPCLDADLVQPKESQNDANQGQSKV